jgi:hypothetical protein
MSTVIVREDLRSLLENWQSGKLSSGQVHEWAEARFATDAWECEDDVANEVLGSLDVLDMNLLTHDDVPVLQAMLQLPAGQAKKAADLLHAHFEGLSCRDRYHACEVLQGQLCEWCTGNRLRSRREERLRSAITMVI